MTKKKYNKSKGGTLSNFWAIETEVMEGNKVMSRNTYNLTNTPPCFRPDASVFAIRAFVDYTGVNCEPVIRGIYPREDSYGKTGYLVYDCFRAENSQTGEKVVEPIFLTVNVTCNYHIGTN